MLGRGVGPIPTRIMLVGEAWGAEEERQREPFVGASGAELNRMLHEAGILRSECFTTNLVNARPPMNDMAAWVATKKKDITSQHIPLRDRMVLPLVVAGYQQLLTEIAACQPNLIIAFGNYAMWALTGKWGILKWRGSHLQMEGEGMPKVIPTIRPKDVLREWSNRAAVLNDLRRAKREMQTKTYTPPAWNFRIKPTFQQTITILQELLNRLAVEDLWLELDLETNSGHIACCGISWSKLDAICIPLMTSANRAGYWTEEEEGQIVWMIYQVLTHPRAKVRLQNGLYDAQYTYRSWHFIPRVAQDTMISQHAIFSDLQKSLAFQASMYAEWYVYWKDEGKQLSKGGSEEQHWAYNCMDCVYTREVGEVELGVVEKLNLQSVHNFQQEMFWPVLKAMTRGVRVLKKERDRLAGEIQEQITHREQLLTDILGHQINPRSSLQMQKLFYEDLKQPVIMSRAKKGIPARPTCDDEALQKIAAREPLLKPIVNCIADIRTLEIFLSNFILAPLDVDGRMRCSYNIGGSESGKSAPKTYRLSSSKNAFGSGTNLQNIPSEKSKSVGKAAARGHIALLGDPYALPNVRSMFGPDVGYTFFDMDLDRADLQVVVWETDDAMLKAALRQGADIHLLNAYIIDGKEPPPLEELVETHPRYKDHRGPMKLKREFAKVFCHATNYVGSPRTIAGHLGRTVAEVDRAQKIWFGAHPGIKKWHERTEQQIQKHRFVENKFGYRWYIFDRIDMILPEAVAWIPQSTVSIVINKIWNNIYKNCPDVEVLMQVHDSLAGQFPTHKKTACLAAMKEQSSIVIPYDDPLIIPTGIGTSETSWGEC